MTAFINVWVLPRKIIFVVVKPKLTFLDGKKDNECVSMGGISQNDNLGRAKVVCTTNKEQRAITSLQSLITQHTWAHIHYVFAHFVAWVCSFCYIMAKSMILRYQNPNSTIHPEL